MEKNILISNVGMSTFSIPDFGCDLELNEDIFKVETNLDPSKVRTYFDRF